VDEGGVNFALFSPCHRVELCLFDSGTGANSWLRSAGPQRRCLARPARAKARGPADPLRLLRPWPDQPEEATGSMPTSLIDPYARALSAPPVALPRHRREFDWGHDRAHSMGDTLIYDCT